MFDIPVSHEIPCSIPLFQDDCWNPVTIWHLQLCLFHWGLVAVGGVSDRVLPRKKWRTGQVILNCQRSEQRTWLGLSWCGYLMYPMTIQWYVAFAIQYTFQYYQMPFCYFAWSQYSFLSLFGSPFLSPGSIHPGANWLLQLLTWLLLPTLENLAIGCLLTANVPFSNGLADCASKSSILLNSMWLPHNLGTTACSSHPKPAIPRSPSSDYFCITSTSPMEGFSLSSILALPLFDQQLWLEALCNAYAHGSRISEAELSLMHHSLSTWLHTYNLNTPSPLPLLRLCSFLRQVLVNVGPWLARQHVLVHRKTL